MDDKDLKINKILYGKQTYGNSIDTEFSHYLSNNIVDLNKFFQDYENFFFFIPKQGEVNSHQYLISRSQEYLRSQFPLDITDFYNNRLNKQVVILKIVQILPLAG